jgi:hypothetical protein
MFSEGRIHRAECGVMAFAAAVRQGTPSGVHQTIKKKFAARRHVEGE